MPPLSPVPASESRLAHALGGLSATRLAISLVLLGLLLSTRLYEETLYAWLDAAWQQLTQLLPAAAYLDQVAGSSVRPLMERPHTVAAVLLFAAGYVALSMGLLCALLPKGEGWRWGLRLYGGIGLLSLVLLLAGRAAGQPLLTVLASRLLHGLLSPLPVMVLVPLLRWPGARVT
ncbi:XrtX-associated membrane protein [Hymenobacter bucti]|uniref:XrtX-associated membrane protein n=1 Tax=Hymenobacter bucti TaxID=1844114 RepID=A0ABW4QWA6_9BACT